MTDTAAAIAATRRGGLPGPASRASSRGPGRKAPPVRGRKVPRTGAVRAKASPGPVPKAPPERALKWRDFPGPVHRALHGTLHGAVLADPVDPADPVIPSDLTVPAPPESSACGTPVFTPVPVLTPAHSPRAIRVRRSPR